MELEKLSNCMARRRTDNNSEIAIVLIHGFEHVKIILDLIKNISSIAPCYALDLVVWRQ